MIKARIRWCTCRVEARSPHNGNHFSSIYICDSQLNRPESVSLASLARQLLMVRANFVLITRKEGGA